MKLSVGIYDGDCDEVLFYSKEDVIDFILKLKPFDCVWLVTGESHQILVTEDVDKIIECFNINLFDVSIEEDKTLFIQEYQSYEDAYAVALDMMEENPKCYN
jgi:hypothetical protein